MATPVPPLFPVLPSEKIRRIVHRTAQTWCQKNNNFQCRNYVVGENIIVPWIVFAGIIVFVHFFLFIYFWRVNPLCRLDLRTAQALILIQSEAWLWDHTQAEVKVCPNSDLFLTHFIPPRAEPLLIFNLDWHNQQKVLHSFHVVVFYLPVFCFFFPPTMLFEKLSSEKVFAVTVCSFFSLCR